MLSKEIRVPIFEWLSGNLEPAQVEGFIVQYYPDLLGKNDEDASVIGCFKLCMVHMDKDIWTEEEAKTEMRELLESLLDKR